MRSVDRPPLHLLEFPADDPERALAFWRGLLEVPIEERAAGEGEGWQTHTGTGGPAIGVHERGRGPGDRFSLPYFAVDDVDASKEAAEAAGASTLAGPMEVPAGRFTVLRDPQGAVFAIFSGEFDD